MQQKEDFYVTVSSNSSGDFFPNNTLTRFSNKCPQAIVLDEGSSWRVGLVEIQLPTNWSLLNEDDLKMAVYGNEIEPQKLQIILEGEVNNTNIGRDILKAFSRSTHTSLKTGVSVTYQSRRNLINITLKKFHKLEILRALLAILGILEQDKNVRIQGERVFLGGLSNTVSYQGYLNTQRSYNTLWVYSNLCSYRMVGESHVPLLRVIPIKQNNMVGGELLHESYVSPHYLQVSQNFFQTIDIYISDSRGKPIPFRPGHVVATLHFRPFKPTK